MFLHALLPKIGGIAPLISPCAFGCLAWHPVSSSEILCFMLIFAHDLQPHLLIIWRNLIQPTLII
jgi:hypothetical protein